MRGVSWPVDMLLLIFCLSWNSFVTAANSDDQRQPEFPCNPKTGNSLPFCNTTLQISVRVADLISRLTLEEKLSMAINTAKGVPRLGIPAYQWWSEGLHGVAISPGVQFDGPIKCATSFPQVISSVSSFNTTLWNLIGQATSTEARAMYNFGQATLTLWAPNINVFRDPRWGRGQETPGEDPTVASVYAAYFVRGLQGDPPPGEPAPQQDKRSTGRGTGEKTTPGGHRSTDSILNEPALCEDQKARRTLDADEAKLTAGSMQVAEPLPEQLAPNEVESRSQSASRGGVRLSRRGEDDKMKKGEMGHPREESGELKASACCKHFTAYDVENWHGVDRFHFNAEVSPQDMADTFLPPFQSCVQRGGATCTMCAYNRINGVPACAIGDLLQGTIRKKWGFHGYIASDCGGIGTFYWAHKWSPTPEHAVASAIKAGTDLNCGDMFEGYGPKAVKSGLLSESEVDNAMANLLSLRMRLGAFDGDPRGQKWGHLDESAVDTSAHQQLALEGARQSIVMMKNENGVLPLDRDDVSVVAVIGPHGNASEAMLGNYQGIPCSYVTPLQGISRYTRVIFEPGCLSVDDQSEALLPPAVVAAKRADVTVLVVGLDQSQESEGLDRTSLLLPGVQPRLVDAVVKAARGPVILVVMGGGPVDVAAYISDRKIPGIFWIGYPGQSGGEALAEVLFGDYNPAGRLPVTWYPESFASKVSLLDMRMRPDQDSGQPGRTHRFYTGPKIFEFGHGLSYSKFSYKDFRAPVRLMMPHGSCSVAEGNVLRPLLQNQPMGREKGLGRRFLEGAGGKPGCCTLKEAMEKRTKSVNWQIRQKGQWEMDVVEGGLGQHDVVKKGAGQHEIQLDDEDSSKLSVQSSETSDQNEEVVKAIQDPEVPAQEISFGDHNFSGLDQTFEILVKNFKFGDQNLKLPHQDFRPTIQVLGEVGTVSEYSTDNIVSFSETYTHESGLDVVHLENENSVISVEVSVTNDGPKSGDHVVFLYSIPPQNLKGAPKKSVVAFTRLHLKALEDKKVFFQVKPAKDLVTARPDGSVVLELGVYKLVVGNLEQEIHILKDKCK